MRRDIADRAPSRAHHPDTPPRAATGPRRRRRGRDVLLLSVLTPAAFVAPLAPSASADPEPVEPTVASVPVAGVDPAAPALPAPEDVAGEAPEVLSGEISTESFSTLGVSWQRDAALEEVEVHVRVRTDGRWSDWLDLHADDADGPDLVETAPAGAGSRVVAAASTPRSDVTETSVARVSTPPVWTGPSDGVQVRVDAEGGVPQGVEVELVDPGVSAADAAVASPRAGAAEAAAVKPRIVTRAEWGADESIRRGSPSYNGTVKAAFIHHTVNSNSYTQAQAPALVRSIYAYHVKSNGWSDVGYNYLIDRFGTVYEGRAGGIDRAVVGAHASGFNTDTFGVSIIGDFTSAAPPAAALDAVQRLIAWKLSLYGRDPLGKTVLTSAGGGTNRFAAGTAVTLNVINGHRDGNNTACPGAKTYALLPQIRAAVAKIPTSSAPAPAPAAAPTPTASPAPTGVASGPSGVTLLRDGTLAPFGASAPKVRVFDTFPFDAARSVAMGPSGNGVVLDLWGGLHGFESNRAQAPKITKPSPYWPNWAIARDLVLLPGRADAGYVLDGFGGVHPFGGAPAVKVSGYWRGMDIARSLALLPDGTGGYVLDGFGGPHPFAVGGAPMPPKPFTSAYWRGKDIARGIVVLGPGKGTVIDTAGGVHGFGGGPSRGSGYSLARPFTAGASSRGSDVVYADRFGTVHSATGTARVGNSSDFGRDVVRDVTLEP